MTVAIRAHQNLCTVPVPDGSWAIDAGGSPASSISTIADARFAGGFARRREYTAASTGNVYVLAASPAIPPADIAVGNCYFLSMRVAAAGNAGGHALVWSRAGVAGAPTISTSSSGAVDHGDGTRTHWAIVTVTAKGTAALAPLLAGFGTVAAGGHVTVGDQAWTAAVVTDEVTAARLERDLHTEVIDTPGGVTIAQAAHLAPLAGVLDVLAPNLATARQIDDVIRHSTATLVAPGDPLDGLTLRAVERLRLTAERTIRGVPARWVVSVPFVEVAA